MNIVINVENMLTEVWFLIFFFCMKVFKSSNYLEIELLKLYSIICSILSLKLKTKTPVVTFNINLHRKKGS